MKSIYRLLRTMLVLLCTAVMLLRCTKTKYENEKRPYNNIETFVVKGYAGDSINAVINEGTIIVYWAAEAAMPATIKPVIAVSAHATISPASGTEVAFSDTTVYKVTAENGSVQTYRLKPVINRAVPKISAIAPNNLHFFSDTNVTISGEYFLSGGVDDVHVYAQRLRDGFEFDLLINYSKLTMTNITAYLPRYSPLLDTGAHKIWVKVGNRVSESKDIMIRIPDVLFSGLMHLAFEEAGKKVAAGDSATLKFWDDYNGDVCKWYKKRFTRLVVEDYAFDTAALTQTDSTIRFKVPDYPVGRYASGISLYTIDPYYNPGAISRQISLPLFPSE